MYRYAISVDGEEIGVRSDTDLAKIFERWKELLHFTGITVHTVEGECEFSLEYSDSADTGVQYGDKQVRIAIPLNKLQTGEVLLYAVLPFLEVLHQRKSVVTIHGAAVELNGGATLMLGRTGAGKTSLTLSLCQSHRARLIGNDIVKVGLSENGVIARTGSKYFFLRQESIKRNMPELLDLFPQSDKDPWTHKIYCLPDKLGIKTCDDQLKITRSYLVHVDETMKSIYTENGGKAETRLYLNENMSRYIRGTAIALFDSQSYFLGYVPSFDTPVFFSMRTQLVETLLLTTRTTYLSGNLNDVCQYIVSEAGA